MLVSPRVRVAAIVLVVLFLASVAYAYWIEPFRLTVETIEIEVVGFEPGADPVIAVYVADLHSTEHNRLEDKVRSSIERIAPDLVLFGGDFITVEYYAADCLVNAEVACSTLTAYRPPLGVWAVWGNNDYPDFMTEAVEGHGIELLVNETRTIATAAGPLRVMGVSDPVTGTDDWARAKASADAAGGADVVLVHSPDGFRHATSRGYTTVLAGHTHGGQFWHPLQWLFPRMFLRLLPGTPAYRAGWYEEKGSRMYVTRGVGTSYVRLRFMTPPEITIVRLVPARR